MSTKELDVNLDVKEFLSNTSTAVNSLDDLRLVDSEAVLRERLEVMREFELQSTSLIFVMTDNCNVMTGRKSGFVTKLTEHCANLIDTAGCICHQGNLLMKEGSKVLVAAQIVTFAELLSIIQYSIDNPTVQRALNNLDTEAIKNIIVSWNRFIELQLDRLLVRFHTFLSSPIVRYCFLMYKKTAQYTDRSISHLNLLSVAVGLNSANVLDEFTALRMVTASSSRSEELQNQSLDMYPSLKRLVELILIIVPHNMVVEADFSKMKFSESAYQSNLNSDTYDSMRFVNSHFCRESYDTFRIPPELISLMRKARSEYVKDVKKSVTPQDEEEKENIKVHLGIYERRTSASVAKEINKVDEDLKKAEEAVNALLAKRQRLTVVSEAAQSRENNISIIIIDNMFKQ